MCQGMDTLLLVFRKREKEAKVEEKPGGGSRTVDEAQTRSNLSIYEASLVTTEIFCWKMYERCYLSALGFIILSN